MRTIRYSNQAEQDIEDIYFHSVTEWGVRRADKYVAVLGRVCDSLITFPDRGRPTKRLRKGLMRLECQRHIIFYQKYEEEILVVRLLHDRMLPTSSHFMD